MRIPSWEDAAAAMAAFNTVVNGGLIPQARQGGMFVAVAVDGSKFEGMGLENVQIGQIHVAFTNVDADGFTNGAEFCTRGDCDLDRLLVFEPELFLSGLGCSVILGEDLRKPA